MNRSTLSERASKHSTINWARNKQEKKTSCKKGRYNKNNDFVFIYETFSLIKLWIRSDEVVICYKKNELIRYELWLFLLHSQLFLKRPCSFLSEVIGVLVLILLKILRINWTTKNSLELFFIRLFIYFGQEGLLSVFCTTAEC